MDIQKVLSPKRGINLAIELLYKNCNHKTALFLSGGSTPKILYEDLAKEQKLRPGAVCLIDERFGTKYHSESNEKMIVDTNLISYLEKVSRFYPILENKPIEETTKNFDETLRILYSTFPKSIGILGIGEDGHTGGIAPNRNDFINPIFADNVSLAGYFIDSLGVFKQRITQTFLALSKLDLIIILVFGDKKKKALELMFSKGNLEEVPSRFFTQEEISKKTILITDQMT